MFYNIKPLCVRSLWKDTSNISHDILIDVYIIESKSGNLTFEYSDTVRIDGNSYYGWKMKIPHCSNIMFSTNLNFAPKGLNKIGGPLINASDNAQSLHKHIHKVAKIEAKNQYPKIIDKMNKTNLKLKSLKNKFYIDCKL